MDLQKLIEAHPRAIVAFVIGGVLILYLLFRGGASATNAASSGSDDYGDYVQSATDAYIAQQQANQQAQSDSDALTAQQDEIGGSLQALTIQSQQTTQANQLQAGVDLAQISATQESTDLANTLSAGVTNQQNTLAAQVDEANVDAQVAQAQIGASTTIATTQTVANALVDESNNQTQAQLAEIGAAQAVQTANIASQQAIATQPWISKIF
jgi:hypothetical protein